MKKHTVTKVGQFYLNRFTFVGFKNNRFFLIKMFIPGPDVPFGSNTHIV